MDESRLNLIVDEILNTIKNNENNSRNIKFTGRNEDKTSTFDNDKQDIGQINVEKYRDDNEVVEEQLIVNNLSAEDEVYEINVDKNSDINLKEPNDIGALVRMKGHTTARIGVGKAGARLKTNTMLKLRADHAAARDAVFTDVETKVLENIGLKTFSTVVKDKNEFLTRPDLGKKFDSKTLDEIVALTGVGNDVLIYAADGLSSTAINANIQNILPVLVDGLKQKGLKVATPFYVRFGRVGSEDPIAEATKSKVVCVLIGERPGLATAESMSAYICYEAYVGQPESRRTVVSNIHKGGTVAIEAGAYIVDVVEEILTAKVSGVELKKQGDTI